MTHYFAAIPVPFERVAEQLDKTDKRYHLSANYKVIPHPADLHVTLLFFGALTSCELRGVKQTMSDLASGTQKFQLSINGISFFGNPSGPRVVYLSVDVQSDLNYLNRQLSNRLEPSLHRSFPKTFTPHVTLAKKRKDTPSIVIEKETFKPIVLEISKIVLYSIDPTTSPKYSPETTFPFIE
ncbi:RNA 2',3'-cyclic phosphodiesterase [Sporosarcina sp. A2]|uniref:RNA 2',3'-cyclic phosphodiesterase n=1 Tax=Sporosarcina sp. A2 TaxID=3393449 RepID=UPI003D78B745